MDMPSLLGMAITGVKQLGKIECPPAGGTGNKTAKVHLAAKDVVLLLHRESPVPPPWGADSVFLLSFLSQVADGVPLGCRHISRGHAGRAALDMLVVTDCFGH